MLLALTNQRMLGLGVVAGLFIVFAALSAFYFPRRNPDFPGNRLGLFVLVTVVLFAGTMAAVVVFAKEEAEAHGAEPATTEHAETGATTEEQGGSQQVLGDAAAGEAVFASAGCGGCHTLKAANTSGAVGPNLDESKPPAELVVERVTDGSGLMPSFEGQLSDKEIADVAAYVVASTQG